MNDQRDPPVLCIDIDRWLKVYPLETTGQTKGGKDWTRSNGSESVVNRPVKQITDSNNDRSSNWKSNRRVDEIMLDRLDLNRVQFVFREFLFKLVRWQNRFNDYLDRGLQVYEHSLSLSPKRPFSVSSEDKQWNSNWMQIR